MSMEQQQEQREWRHVTNNQCSSIEREREQKLIRRDLDRLRRERENNEDAQERLAFTKHDLIELAKCVTIHAGWLGAGSMKEIDVKQ